MKKLFFPLVVILFLTIGFENSVKATTTINIDLQNMALGIQPPNAFDPYFVVNGGEFQVNDYTRNDFHPHPGRFIRQLSEGSFSDLYFTFSEGLRSLTFVRMGTSLGASTPGWILTLFDADGNVLGSIGDGNTLIVNGAIQTFSFSAPDERNIASAQLENFYNSATMLTAPFIEWSFEFETLPVAIPTMSEWFLIILGLVLLSLGTLTIIRKQKTLARLR